MNRDKIMKILDTWGVLDVREQIADEILASQWISVEEDPPEENQPVWAWTPKFKRQYTVVAPLKEHFTHWCSLLDPPEDR